MGKFKIDCRTGEISPSTNHNNYFINNDKLLYAFYSYGGLNAANNQLKAIIFGNFLIDLRKQLNKNTNKGIFIHVYSRADGSFNLQLGQNIQVNFYIAVRTFSIKLEGIIMHRTENKYTQDLVKKQQKNIFILKTLSKTIDTWEFPKNMKVPAAYKKKYDKYIKK